MIKKILCLICLLFAGFAYATEAENEWSETKLSDLTIKKIQQAQYQYKKCAIGKMQKIKRSKIEVKVAANTIIKQCESALSQLRQVYLDAAVPSVIADRHLKKMRTDVSRRVVKQLMFSAAAHKAGAN